MSEKLVKSKQRVADVGEVFTPSWLVDELLNELPPNLFDDPTKTFIDPACGDGNFLIEVVKRKLMSGATPLQALSATYGVDIMPDNVVECRQRLFATVAASTDLNYSREPHLLKRYLKRRNLRKIQQTLRSNIRYGDTLKFDIEDIFATQPSEELQNFRNKKEDTIKLDSGTSACYTVGTVEIWTLSSTGRAKGF